MHHLLRLEHSGVISPPVIELLGLMNHIIFKNCTTFYLRLQLYLVPTKNTTTFSYHNKSAMKTNSDHKMIEKEN